MYGNKTETSERIIFSSQVEAKQYLEDFFSNLNEGREFNIFLHQIHDYYDDMLKLTGKDLVIAKMNKLMKTSLHLTNYSSLSGTTMLKGSTKDINVDSVVDYNFYNTHHKVICIVAIPKYIDIENEQIEYSSYKNVDSWNLSEELNNKYKKLIGFIPNLHHKKCSLFDVIKQFEHLPKEYMLGFLTIDNHDNIYEFIKLSNHLAFLSQEEQVEHDKKIANKIKKLYTKHGTKDVEEIIVKEYFEHEKIYERLESIDI